MYEISSRKYEGPSSMSQVSLRRCACGNVGNAETCVSVCLRRSYYEYEYIYVKLKRQREKQNVNRRKFSVRCDDMR